MYSCCHVFPVSFLSVSFSGSFDLSSLPLHISPLFLLVFPPPFSPFLHTIFLLFIRYKEAVQVAFDSDARYEEIEKKMGEMESVNLVRV